MAARPQPTTSRTAPQAAGIVGFSAVVMTAAIVATASLGLGVRTSYGSGIQSAAGEQVTRDFIADQDAEAAALSKSDQSLLDNRLSQSALVDVVQQIQGQTGTAPTVIFQPSSITVLRSQDPRDPSLLIEVQEDGVKTVTSNGGPNSAPIQDQVAFHGDFWLALSGGRYLIADQNIQNQPTSYLPQTALVVVALVWVGLAYVLYRRTRRPLVPATAPTPPFPAPPAEAPVVFDVIEEAAVPSKTVIRTFGGLQVMEDGTDWAAAFGGRPAMGFLWRRMLLATLESPAATVVREVVAVQINPSVDRETQLKRLRGLVGDGLRELPKPLSRRVVVEPRILRFELEDCSVDALELVRTATELTKFKVLTPLQAGRARALLEATRGTFMPEFETVEDLVTVHHPTCTELIRNIRQQLGDRHNRLLALLAKTYIAGRRSDLAVAVLEPTAKTATESELRDLLADAYRATGREADARALVGV